MKVRGPVTLLIALALLAVIPGIAAAEGDPSAVVRDSVSREGTPSDEAPLPIREITPVDKSGGLDILSAYIGGSCWGQSYPPLETSGYAWGHGATFCDSNEAYLYALAGLKRDRWWGWQTMDTKDDDCVACDDVDVYPTWDCSGTGTYTYRTATYS
ncbi:MAG: hypothetical protein GY788_05755, partial [bacterium]|nr:hypothetical protein [bacterium]